MASLALAFDILARDRGASRTFDKVGDAAQRAGKKGGAFGSAMKGAVGLAAKATAGAAAGIVAGLGASINKAMDYDKTMRLVGATLGTTAAQQKALGALAIKMGADTVFSAKDAGEAMLELAKGGLTTAQIQGGALASTMTLAAAGGLQMGSAATYVGNALNTFGLKAKDATGVAAALAGGANASSASVESLGQALSQVGPGAKTAGLSIQTTTAILAAFDNAGIKGSDAGTSLKTMLTRLVPATDKASGAMSDLGLKFTDAKGKFLPMRDIAQQLQNKLKGLSDEQKSTALTTIFGSDATRAATVLADLGAKGVDRYTKATSDQAAAQRMANTQMQGASGAWEAFKGSVETLAISIGVKLLPTFTRVVKWLTDVTNVVATKAGPALASLGDWFTNKGLPAIKAFGGWLKNDLWPALKEAYQTIMPSLKQAFDTIAGAFKSTGSDGSTFGDKLREVGKVITDKVIPFIALMIRVYLPGAAAQLRGVIEVVKTLYGVFITWRNTVAKVLSFIIGKLGDLMGVFGTMLAALSHVPGFGWAKDAAAKLKGAADKAHALAAALAEIPTNKTVTVNTYFQTHGVNPLSTKGSGAGIKGYASGGSNLPRGWRIAGEKGPELQWSPGGDTIIPASRTRALLNGGGGGGGGGTGRMDLSESSLQRLAAILSDVHTRTTVAVSSVDAAMASGYR